MRLLKCDELSGVQFTLTADLIDETVIPRYAILSHTWGPDVDEVTFKDLIDGTGGDKIGYQKLKFCAEQARRDGLEYFWVDTCCIEKANYTELSHASTRCLDGFSGTADDSAFRDHRWFTRGWTLQELIAPNSVEFFTQHGVRIGDKRSLEQEIHSVTGIAVPALRGAPLSGFVMEERFKWAGTRSTTRPEDWAYCLLGICDVSMPLIYGEGRSKAIHRLRKSIAENAFPSDSPLHQAVWMVPLERNPSFTGREAELRQLRQKLFVGEDYTSTVAITGLGGVGKTHLVLELLYRTRIEYLNCSTIWIPATSNKTLEQSFLSAAEKLGIGQGQKDGADVKALVRDYLSSEAAGQWLLVFDNADDIDMWFGGPTSGRLFDYIPRSSRGSVIFTSRDKKAAVRLAGHSVIDLKEITEEGSVELLGSYLVDKTLLKEHELAKALVQQLTYLPLAVVQAAAYINSSGIDLKSYLELMSEHEENEISLLSEDFEDKGRYRGTRNPVATTWLVSFEDIKRRDSLAADYLSFMACIDFKDIPVSILPPVPSTKQYIDALATLRGYSFVSTQAGHSIITLHRLVHLATRNWLRKEGLLSSWSAKVTTRIADLLNRVDEFDRLEWRSYLPHASFAIKSGGKNDEGCMALGKMNPAKTERPPKSRRQIFKSLFKSRSSDSDKSAKQWLGMPGILTSPKSASSGQTSEDEVEFLEEWRLRHNYCTCLELEGRYQEAETSVLKLLEGETLRFGETDRRTSKSKFLLASIQYRQERWDEAERLFKVVIGADTMQFGEEYPAVLDTMHNLAVTLTAQGRWDESEELLRRRLDCAMKAHGNHHQETLKSKHNLASFLMLRKRLLEAEELQQSVVDSYVEIVGEQHPNTLNSMSLQGDILAYLCWWDKAEHVFQRVLETQIKVLGERHPRALVSMLQLANTIMNQDRRDAAVALHHRALSHEIEVRGRQQENILFCMRELSHTYASKGFLDEAEQLATYALDTLKTTPGWAGHSPDMVVMVHLSEIWWLRDRKEEAFELMQEALELAKRVLGLDHPYTKLRGSKVEKWREVMAHMP